MVFGYLDYSSESLFLKGIGLEKSPESFQSFMAFDSSDAMYHALQTGKIDAAAILLTDVPLALGAGLTIAALRGRKEKPCVGLIVLKDNAGEAGNAIELLSAGQSSQPVLVGGQVEKSQIAALTPQTEMVVKDHFSVLDLLGSVRQGKCGSGLVSWFALQQHTDFNEDFAFFPFHRQELVPQPGDGVYAFIALEKDTSTRRALLQIHQPEVASATNVERRVQQIFEKSGKSVAAYCEQDKLGYYHLWAANETGKKIRASSATHYLLAEQAANLLNAED